MPAGADPQAAEDTERVGHGGRAQADAASSPRDRTGSEAHPPVAAASGSRIRPPRANPKSAAVRSSRPP